MIRKLAASLVCMAWGLWLGGLFTLFLLVTRLFAADRETALKAAPQMFSAFERYQLILAAGALTGAVIWRIISKSICVTILFWVLALAALPAALGPMLISSRMQRIVESGKTDTPEFKKLHGESMLIYSGETLILIAAGLLLPWAMRNDEPKPVTQGSQGS